jgi:PIN domain nuclease of toxin-antitoxin system
VKYLLDTHIVFWIAENSPNLSTKVKRIILDSSEKYVSIVSAWEVAIKISTGKLTLNGGVVEFFRMIDENGFTLLPVKQRYIEYIQTLAFHHRDPFDRLLVATAAIERMSLITVDKNIYLYDISCIG